MRDLTTMSIDDLQLLHRVWVWSALATENLFILQVILRRMGEIEGELNNRGILI